MIRVADLNMKHKLFIYILTIELLLISVTMYGQSSPRRWSRMRHQPQVSDTTNIINNYIDSLKQYKAAANKLKYSQHGLAITKTLRPEYKNMFEPTTFYDNVAADLFSVDRDDCRPDLDALSYIYIWRPDLVQQTERDLSSTKNVEPINTQMYESSSKTIAAASKAHDNIALPDIDIILEKPNFWTYTGDYSLQFYQNYVSSNWYQGGENSYSMLTTLTLQANYNNKQKFKWENKLEIRLGIQHLKEDTVRAIKTSEDLIRYTSKLGIQASKKWYYTLQLVANTQLLKGYAKNGASMQSAFMSPFNLNISLGMDYSINWLKDKLTGSIHLAPIAYNYKYCNRSYLAESYGIDAGKRHKGDYGSQMTIDFLWNLTKDISWKSRYYFYTTYNRVEMQFENTFAFKVNRYISCTFFIYPRFDDNAPRDNHHGYFQFKEYLSMGFNYAF